jgi:site-specific recombinase XerD
MKSTFKILFYIKRNAQKKDGTMPVVARITVNGKISQFNTKLYALPELWSVEKGKATGRTKEAVSINNLLEEIKTSIHKVYHELRRKEAGVTSERVRNEFLGINLEQDTLLTLFKKHNDDFLKLVGISKSKATYQKYEVTRKRLSDFLMYKYKIKDIALKEINYSFISYFETYLRSECNCGTNITAKYLQQFKRIVIIAKNNGWIVADPFANFKIRLEKVDRGYLTKEELNTIMGKEFTIKRLEQVRDVFIFSCFTGLAYVDAKNLRQNNISTSFDNETWIMTKRKKTGIASNIPLLEVPKMILNKYKDVLHSGQLLPILSNQKTNSYLKEIADLCGIEKNLTFHLARHTFATTVTLSKGVPIESVSKMLGHTNIRTTQIYARITNEKIGLDMKKLASKLKDSNFSYAQL